MANWHPKVALQFSKIPPWPPLDAQGDPRVLPRPPIWDSRSENDTPEVHKWTSRVCKHVKSSQNHHKFIKSGCHKSNGLNMNLLCQDSIIIQYVWTQYLFNMSGLNSSSICQDSILVQYVRTQCEFNMSGLNINSICLDSRLVCMSGLNISSICQDSVLIQYVRTHY